MFSLIVTIISIALVAALALATLYYGGSAYTDSQARADAARSVNAGQQISGAVALYGAREGGAVSDITQLVTAEYLSVVPSGTWQVVDGGVARTDLSEDQCMAANKLLGVSSVPSCTDPLFSGKEVCCSMPE